MECSFKVSFLVETGWLINFCDHFSDTMMWDAFYKTEELQSKKKQLKVKGINFTGKLVDMLLVTEKVKDMTQTLGVLFVIYLSLVS